MTKRLAEAPPELAGFTPIELIGSGGYADVFLYQQHRPDRRVAVKVLAGSALSGQVQRANFTAEADLMARVSAHPYIVQIFQAEIARDGRPYLVMEHYPGGNWLERARHERLSVGKVLQTGIQVAGAVETAHRVGILHRDIKPANILTSEFGRPGLTDFGIAATRGPADDSAQGISIPWSPPEGFGSELLDERADIYSLGATLHHLLSGRSPFELPGGDNSALGLMDRIQRRPVPPIDRADVSTWLQRVLATAMAKDPDHRPESALALALLLQEIEAELKLASTPVELPATENLERARDNVTDDDATRVRGITEVRGQDQRPLIRAVPDQPMASAPKPPRPREGLLDVPDLADTFQPPPSDGPGEAPSAGRRRLAILVGTATLAGIGLIFAFGAFGSRGDAGRGDAGAEVAVNDGVGNLGDVARSPDPVKSLVGEANADGTFTFTWNPPAKAPAGTLFQVTESATADQPAIPHQPQTQTTFTGASPCIDVSTVVTNLLSAPVRGCVGP